VPRSQPPPDGRAAGAQSHARTHTSEKPYACESCDKSFVKKDDLKSHARTHSGEKPYACESCEKRFSKHSALTVHARTHTGKKPYACESCLLRFNQASHLTHRTRRSCPRASLAAAARWASGGRAVARADAHEREAVRVRVVRQGIREQVQPHEARSALPYLQGPGLKRVRQMAGARAARRTDATRTRCDRLGVVVPRRHHSRQPLPPHRGVGRTCSDER